MPLSNSLGTADGAFELSILAKLGDSDGQSLATPLGDVVGTLVTSLGKSLPTTLGACDKEGEELNDAVGDIVAAVGDPVEMDGEDVGSSSQ